MTSPSTATHPVELPEIHPLHIGVGACGPRPKMTVGMPAAAKMALSAQYGTPITGVSAPSTSSAARALRLVAVDLERLADDRRVQLGINRRTACGDLVQQG